MYRSHFRTKLALAGLVGASALAGTAQAATCPDILALVDAGLSADVGDVAKMASALSPSRPSSATSMNFDVKSLQQAVDADGFAIASDECCTDAKCVYRNRADEVIRIKAERGKIAFLSHARSSEPQVNDIAEADAIGATMEAMQILGIPADEVDTDRVRAAAIVETLAYIPGTSTLPSQSRRSEVLVRIRRQIGGIPVEDSGVGAAIAPSGQFARLRATWPNFELAPGLDPADTMPRSEVLELVAAELSELNPCGSLSGVHSEIQYIPQAWIEGTGDADETDHIEGEPHPVDRALYQPALKVFALPIEQAEDSGITQEAGLIMYLPLLRSGDR